MRISLSALRRFIGMVLFVVLAVGSGIAAMSFVDIPDVPHTSVGPSATGDAG